MNTFNIKYNKTDEIAQKECIKIEKVRSRLFSLGLLNSFDENSFEATISTRYKKKKSFIITGKKSSELPKLNPSYYSFVKNVDFKSKTINAIGPKKPSQHSAIHFSIYSLDEEIKSVIIISNKKLFESIVEDDPLILKSLDEVHKVVEDLYQEVDPLLNNIVLVDDGSFSVISFGKSFPQAEKSLYSMIKTLIEN